MADDEAAKPRRTSKATTAAPKRATKKAPAAAKAGAAKAPAKKAAPAKAPVRKARARATPDPAAKKAPARKVAAKQAPPTLPEAEGRRASSLLKPRAKKAPPMRLAAEQTFDDDWERRAPEPVREDPAARIRGVLRAAARSIEGREQAQARGVAPVPPSPPEPPPPPPAPPPPPQPPAARPADEPVTRVLVAPLEAEPADEQVDEVEEQAEVEGEAAWAAPDVMEEPAPPPPPAPPSPPPPPPPPVATEPPPWEPPSAKAADVRRGGAGTSLLAIVLSVLVPIVGAVVGLVLAGRARSRGAALAGVARVVAVLALVVWLVGGGVVAYAALNDEGVDYSKLKVGDCFDSSATNEVRGVKVKPCAKPHNSEIFFLVTHPAGPREPYPGKDALVQFAADACLGQPLTDYLGVPLEQSKLKDFEIVPQESAWKDGRRMLVCGVDTGGQGNLTGSVKGTRR